MIHTDVPDYPAVLEESWRVLADGDFFVHIGFTHKVVATHIPLPHSFIGAGFVLNSFKEGGTPIPTVLAVRALKPA